MGKIGGSYEEKLNEKHKSTTNENFIYEYNIIDMVELIKYYK